MHSTAVPRLLEEDDGVIIIIMIKRIPRVPIYRTRWEHRALYQNTNNTHMHARTHARMYAYTRTPTHTLNNTPYRLIGVKDNVV